MVASGKCFKAWFVGSSGVGGDPMGCDTFFKFATRDFNSPKKIN